MQLIDKSVCSETALQNAAVMIQGFNTFGSNKWKIIPNDSDCTSYRIMSESSGYQYALGVNTNRWCHQVQYVESDTKAKWDLQYIRPLSINGIQDGVYRIKNVNSNLYMDVPNGATSDGTQIRQYADNGNNSMSSNQLWRVKYNWDSTYIISPMHCQSKALRVTGSANNAPIELYPHTTNVITLGASVRWKITEDPNTANAYQIASSASNFEKVIAVENASVNEGAGLLQYTYGKAANDRWFFDKMPIP